MFSFLLKGKKKKKKKKEEGKKRGKCEVWGFVSYLQSSVHHGFVRDLNMFLLLKKIAADRTERFTFVCARCPKGLKRKTKPEPGQSIFTLSLSLSLSLLFLRRCVYTQQLNCFSSSYTFSFSLSLSSSSSFFLKIKANASSVLHHKLELVVAGM